MIVEADLSKDPGTALEAHDLQRRAYRLEAELLSYPELPPLRETVSDLQACGETFLLHREEGRLLGLLSFTVQGDVFEICRLAVHPEHFRRGIAGRLLQAAEGRAAKNGRSRRRAESAARVTRLRVSTGEANLPAVALYERHGFRTVEREVLPDGLVLAHLEKVLAGAG